MVKPKGPTKPINIKRAVVVEREGSSNVPAIDSNLRFRNLGKASFINSKNIETYYLNKDLSKH